MDRIPETDEVKLGEGDPVALARTTLIQIARTCGISPIPKRGAGRGALPGVLEISSQPYFR